MLFRPLVELFLHLHNVHVSLALARPFAQEAVWPKLRTLQLPSNASLFNGFPYCSILERLVLFPSALTAKTVVSQSFAHLCKSFDEPATSRYAFTFGRVSTLRFLLLDIISISNRPGLDSRMGMHLGKGKTLALVAVSA